MDTETVFAAALDQLTHKHHLAVNFLNADVVVHDALEGFLHLVQLVVVGSKQRLGPGSVLVDVLDNAPGNGDTVIGARATAQFIEQNEASLTHVVEDGSRLGHLDHEGRFAQRDVVTGSHTGENLVHHANARLLGRNKTAHLRH